VGDRKQYDKVAAMWGAWRWATSRVGVARWPHPLAIRQASLTLTPQAARLDTFRGTSQQATSRQRARSRTCSPNAFRDDTLRGTATVRSKPVQSRRLALRGA
jgi:hypothetical protein